MFGLVESLVDDFLRRPQSHGDHVFFEFDLGLGDIALKVELGLVGFLLGLYARVGLD